MMKEIPSGVTAAKGFRAAGLRAGIKAGKTNKDMSMIYSEAPAVCAGTFTRNIVKAAPVLWDQKLVAEEGTGRLLGAQLMCARATDLIGEAALALSRGLTLRDLAETIHPHPTFCEALSDAAF